MSDEHIDRMEPDSLEVVQAFNKAELDRAIIVRDSWFALDPNARNQIAANKLVCPVCKGEEILYYKRRNEVFRADKSTGTSGIRCPCQGYRILSSEFHRLVPSGYQQVAKSLEPNEKVRASLEFQKRVIDLLKSKKAKSFAFFGHPGCGKTYNSFWLFVNSLTAACVTNQGTSPLRADASAIVRAHHAWVTRDHEDESIKPPIITAEQAPRHPVFISEFEKIGAMTDYKYEVLFTIVNAIYEKRPKCQLVIDSNLTIDEFEAYFTDKISRRIAELCYCIDYFNETIIEPTEESMR
jgi:hypothetical protein